MRTYINTLVPGQNFFTDQSDTLYICVSRTSVPGATEVVYTTVGGNATFSFTRPGLTMVTTV